MVKVDATRNYYADLELPSDCSTDDVKKQFRKLALKYHPDRNPGKELEYNPRFQAIQAAHEVLGDPDQRSKYDVSRIRGNINNSSSRPTPPRRNQYQPPPPSNFPPPPRRTGPNATAPNSGAERYTNFPAPPTARKDKPSSSQDAKDRANTFTAWQHMHNAQKAQAQRNQGYTSSPGPADASQRRPPSANNDGPPRKPTTYDDLRRPQPDLRRTASGRAQRKAGFDPTSPSGDEGPAPSSRFPSSGPSPVIPPRPQVPTARKSEMPGQFRRSSGADAPYVEGERVRTPYMAHSEEKTYFDPGGIRRSASTRDATKLNQPHERRSETVPTEHQASRHHSHSPPHKNSTAGSTAGKGQQAAGPRPILVYSSSEASDESSSSSSDEPTSAASKPSARPKARPSRSWAKRNGTPPVAQSTSWQEQQSGRVDGLNHDGGRDQKYQKPPTIFTFPVESDTFTRSPIPEMRARTEHVDTNFSPGGGPVPFSGNSASGEVPRRGSLPAAMPFRGRVSSRSEQPSPAEGYLSPEERPPNPYPAGEQSTPSQGGTVFSPEQWGRKIQEDNWASRWASPPPQGISPTRNAANSRKSRGAGLRAASSGAARAPMTPHPASVEEEEAGDPQYFTGPDSGERPGSTDSNAMDIDPTPPRRQEEQFQAGASFPQQSPQQQQPRHVFVEPARPEWQYRASNGDHPIPPPPPGPPTAASRTSPTLDMKGLNSVPPFQFSTSGGGLYDLNDVSTSLPFQSQSSSSHPDRPPSRFERAELPKLPKAPFPPLNHTQKAWTVYIEQMKTYISAWNKFNAEMVGIFQIRATQQFDMERGPAGGMLVGWLEVTGETSALGGWDSYVKSVEDDDKAREYWKVAYEKHLAAVSRHGRLRKEVMQKGLQG